MARLRSFTSMAAFVCAAATVAVPVATHAASLYKVTPLVSDQSGVGKPDANLQNGWGVAFNPTAFVWVADNGTGHATLYDGNGNVQSLVVDIPSPDSLTGGTPTGITFNASNDFAVTDGTSSAPARFLFATEDGVIAGWAPNVPNVPGVTSTQAFRAVTRAGAVYKGLAIAGDGTANRLYAANFVNGTIDVYSNTFAPTAVPGGFTDRHLPSGFGPFNIMNIQGNLYVAYAKQTPGSNDETAGQGLGFVDVFDADGFLLKRLVTRGQLNAPWGMALAPAGFGQFSNRLLVGNLGDGTINAYDPVSGNFVGTMRADDGRPLVIDGLWGIAFGNGIDAQPTDTVFFAAGPGDESQGLYGRIDVSAKTAMAVATI